jgi:hypothetical protein
MSDDKKQPDDKQPDIGKQVMKNSTALTPLGADDNPFADYANAALAGNITGTLLKFTKGDWLAGKNNEEVPLGTRMVANMNSFSVGWMRWSNGKVTDARMGRVVDRFVPARRNELGDSDSDLWEVDDNNVPKDPWQFTNNLELADPETSELYTFSTSSNGGRRCCENLCKSYSRERARHPDEWPVVELGVDSYQHSNKAYGRIKVPTLKIVGWADKDDDGHSAPELIANPLGGSEPSPDDPSDPHNYDPPF